MRKIAIFIFCVVFFIGCASKKEIVLENLGYDSNLVSLESIDTDIVQSIKHRFNINDLLEFEIILKSDEELDVAYKVVWLDEHGFELRNAIDESYKVLHLLPHRQISISKLAQDKRAKSFKIYLTTKGL